MENFDNHRINPKGNKSFGNGNIKSIDDLYTAIADYLSCYASRVTNSGQIRLKHRYITFGHGTINIKSRFFANDDSILTELMNLSPNDRSSLLKDVLKKFGKDMSNRSVKIREWSYSTHLWKLNYFL